MKGAGEEIALLFRIVGLVVLEGQSFLWKLFRVWD